MGWDRYSERQFFCLLPAAPGRLTCDHLAVQRQMLRVTNPMFQTLIFQHVHSATLVDGCERTDDLECSMAKDQSQIPVTVRGFPRWPSCVVFASIWHMR